MVNPDDSQEHYPLIVQGGVVHSGDRWLRECRSALVHRKVIEIDYAAISSQQTIKRTIEPIGLFTIAGTGILLLGVAYAMPIVIFGLIVLCPSHDKLRILLDTVG